MESDWFATFHGKLTHPVKITERREECYLRMRKLKPSLRNNVNDPPKFRLSGEEKEVPPPPIKFKNLWKRLNIYVKMEQ